MGIGRTGGIVRDVSLVGEDGIPVQPVCRFLRHLLDSGGSPNTAAAYGYDLKYLFEFFAEAGFGWEAFSPSVAMEFLGWLRTRPSRRPAQRLGLAAPVAGGRSLAPAALARVLATVSSFLLSPATLFDESFMTACATAGLVNAARAPTVSAHRLRHTLGTQLAEGRARIQTIMAILGHKSAAMSVIYSRISEPEVRRQYEDALVPGGRIAGPAAEMLRTGELDAGSVHWLQTNFLKTELELGHCLRLPAEGPCECDLMLTCSKFLTTSEYAPRLRERLKVEEELAEDARTRGWPREVERHKATRHRIAMLLREFGELDSNARAG